MILVDPRRGSGELLAPLSRKVECQIDGQLPAGDFMWEGHVPSGWAMVGVERKRISEAVDCMCTGKLAGFQLIEMFNLYKWNYLIIEGLWRPNKDTGMLEVWSSKHHGWDLMRKGSRAFTHAEFTHFLTSLTNNLPVHYYRTTGQDETVQTLVDLYTWHQKPWGSHTSHEAIYDAPVTGDRVELTFRKPSLRRVIAHRLPGIGHEKSKAVESFFKSTWDMMNATVEQWMSIEGIGKGIANKLYKAIREE